MTWIVMLAVGFGSFLFRLGPLLVFQRISLTERGDRVIRHAGFAAITALIVVSTKHAATESAAMPTVLALAAAIVLAIRGATMLRLLVGGGGVYVCAVVMMDLLTR